MARRNEDSVLIEKAHDLAIREFQAWLESHPRATRKRKAKQFDIYCDSAILKLHIDKKT